MFKNRKDKGSKMDNEKAPPGETAGPVVLGGEG
jgi:hypothetical protein